jgi:hypothetical protein
MASLLSLSFPFLSFHNNFLLTSTGQAGEPMSMVENSNDAFSPKEVPFWGLIGKIGVYEVNDPHNPSESGRGLWFPSQTRRIKKNSYLSRIKFLISTQNLNRRWKLSEHIRFWVKCHLSSIHRWRQPPL